MEFILYFKGIFVGFLIAAPVGPVGILCAQRTLQIGLLAGLVSGFGAAIADTIFGAVAAFGLTFIAQYLLENEALMRLIGGLLLVGIGVETMLKKPVRIQSDKLPKAHRYAASFFRTFMLTITNPITIMAFGPVFVAANAVVEEGNLLQAWALILGVFSGSALWFSMLCSGVHLGRHHLNDRRMRWMNRISGIVIVFFGAMAVASLTPVGKQLFGDNTTVRAFTPAIANPKEKPEGGGTTSEPGRAATSGATTGAPPKPDTKPPETK
ncbi:MAG: LysE family translocator [Alphaproteobacteria bacterium]|jgi:threonine/homoserine/homoserine lactone efflux protein